MPLNYNPRYKELCDQIGSYRAVVQMADETRAICKSLPHRISDSTALDYVARGEKPNPKDFPDHRLDRVREYLLYVDNLEIKAAVIHSYEESLKKNNLVYLYQNVSDEPTQARVRVIMNILWDSRPHKDR